MNFKLIILLVVLICNLLTYLTIYQTLVDTRKLPREAKSTAYFCRIVDRWFSLMSLKHPYQGMVKDDPRIKELQEVFDQVKCPIYFNLT